jgi:hypothetical protein
MKRFKLLGKRDYTEDDVTSSFSHEVIENRDEGNRPVARDERLRANVYPNPSSLNPAP